MDIIDFHVHLFPDKIAKRAVENVERSGGLLHFSDGKMSGLTHTMADSGITASVILPVLSNPLSFDSAVEFARRINDEKGDIISFAPIHPLCEDLEDKLKRLRDMGFLGIKLHPDYQRMDIDCPEYMRLIKLASDMGFITLLHAGLDEAYSKSLSAHPEKIRHMIDEVRPKNLIVAHLGGYAYWEISEKYLGDCDVWFDTAYCHTAGERFEKLVKSLGPERIIFGSDSPWVNPKLIIDMINRFDITARQKEAIFCKNALKILGTNPFASVK